MKRKFHFDFDRQNPSFIIVGLVVGAALAVGGSVLATSVGSSISVTSDLSVTGASTLTGNTGIATTTAGSLLSIQGVGNFVSAATSTLYTPLALSNLTATSTVLLAMNTGFVGIATSSPGSLFSIQGIGNFVNAATSTLYTPFITSNFIATSTVLLATNTGFVGIATTSPGSLFSIQGVGNFVGGSSATSTLYSGLAFPGLLATSSGLTVSGGNIVHTGANFVVQSSGTVGVSTSSPGSLFSIHGVANFVGTADATSTIYTKIQLPSFHATSTIATSTFSNGLLISTTNGSVGIGTTTPLEKFSLAGSALIGAGANGTSTLIINASGVDASGANVGSCIQMRAASSSDLYRIYLGKNTWSASTTGLIIEQGSCR